MDFNKLMVETMRLCQQYAVKAVEFPLSEYEVLAYEQACKLIENFCKAQALQFEQMSLSSERELYNEKIEHGKWLNSKEDDDDDSAANSTNAA